jgi:hypothetical protein
VLVNSGSAQRRLRLLIPLHPGADVVDWAVAEGAEAELFLQPADGRGPLLVGRLRQGSVEKITERGLELPELVLDPAERYVLAWEWVWLPRPAAYGRRWPTIRPPTTTCLRRRAVRVPAGPDVALVAPPYLGIETVDDGYELTADEPGSALVELRSGRGLRTLELTWTPTVAELLGRAANDLLASSRRAAGIAVLPGIEAALIVQHAQTGDLIDDRDEAGDALDRYTARLDEDRLDPVLGGLLLCGEYARLGDAALLDSATGCVRRAERPLPGLGLVAVRICVARLLAGLSPQPVMDRLLQLASDIPVSEDGAAAAELIAVTRAAGRDDARRADPRNRPSDQDALLRLVLALGTALGSGLPGGPVSPLPVDRLGHLLATLAVVPDDLAAATRRAWGVSARNLVERSTPTLLARLVGRPVGLGHVWLTLLPDVA